MSKNRPKCVLSLANGWLDSHKKWGHAVGMTFWVLWHAPQQQRRHALTGAKKPKLPWKKANDNKMHIFLILIKLKRQIAAPSSKGLITAPWFRQTVAMCRTMRHR